MFYKIFHTVLPPYHYELIPSRNFHYNTRNVETLEQFRTRMKHLKTHFFPIVIGEWVELDEKTRKTESLIAFKKAILKSVWKPPNPVYNIHKTLELKLLTCLCLGLSHLQEHKFRHNFRDCINPLCLCNLEPETTIHFFPRCRHCTPIGTILLNDLKKVAFNITHLSDDRIVQVILYGDTNLSIETKLLILNASILYTLQSEIFNGPLS